MSITALVPDPASAARGPAPDGPAPAEGGVRRPRAIVRPRRLAEALRAAAEAAMRDGEVAQRAALLPILKEALADGRSEIRRRFEQEAGGGPACLHETCHIADQLIRALAHAVTEAVYPAPNPTKGERFAIVATGGYGRGELAPQSDLDLLFLLPWKRGPRVEQVVEFMLYLLWDLGLKVGHAVRTVDECVRQAKADSTICTALLETRPLWGERALYDDLRRRFQRDVAAQRVQSFVEAKLAERDQRHLRLGDSRYVLEPNVKDGKGGLRDLHTLFWIGKYLYQVDDVSGLVEKGVLSAEEAQRFAKAGAFLATLRCHLHYLTGRPDDRLTFDLQVEIGRRMGYTDHAGTTGVERFMKHYFLVAKEVGSLTRIFCAALEAESLRKPRRLFRLGGQAAKAVDGFVIEGERLTVSSVRQFREQPSDLIKLFRVAQRRGVLIHPRAMQLVTRSLKLVGNRLRADPEANRLFLEILTAEKNPEPVLREMNETGLLGRFIPDFGRVVAQMQYDMYHVFTVDEHTLFALGILHRIETGEAADRFPLAARLVRQIASRRALYLALFCHDIAKGRGGDHSILGARIVARLGPRLGLTDEETETAEWLVRWHLLMSDVALKRDPEDDKTVQDFTAAVASPERLKLLTVLTTCDISAVGPGRWNAWKATLLGQLYARTAEIMSGNLDVEGASARVEAAKGALAARLEGWSAADREELLSSGYPGYWLAFDAETHARQAPLIRQARREGHPLIVKTRVDEAAGGTEVTILTQDHPGLFARLAGALSVAGANIVDARIFTFADGLALDVFTVQDQAEGGALAAPEKLARLSVMVQRALAGELRPDRELARRRSSMPARTRVFRVAPRVIVDNHASRTHTVVEINARDRVGLLHDIARAFGRASVSLSSARIATFGERAVDTFYVKDVFGLKITHEQKLAQLREVLLQALADPAAPPPA